MNHERIAGLSAFDKKRACLRIGRLASLHAGRIKAAGVDCERDHMVARLDTKHGRMSAGEGVVKFCGLKPMGFGRTANSQRDHQEQFHIYPPV
jgi:hypothetical protein